MLNKAEERGFKPEFILFDAWYSSIKTLKTIRKKMTALVNKVEEKSVS
jgi:putative transposase